MPFRVTPSMLALMLVLACALAQAAAESPNTARPQASLWSVLNLPTFNRTPKPSNPKPTPPTVAEKTTLSLEPLIEPHTDKPHTDKPHAVKPPAEPPPESAVASPFSPTISSRRGTIQKRESAHAKSAPPDINSTASQPPVTPHWTPKFAEQAASFQLSDEECARPVAVNMAGDLISQRITVARAVARMDPTLRVAPSVAPAIAKSDPTAPTPAAHLATASPAAAH